MNQTQILTRKGYDFYEVSSAFQKSIRRGEEIHALFFATELAGSGYAKYVWKRMPVIASEDIGLANNNAIMLIRSLYESWELIAESNHEEAIIPIVHAVIFLTRSKKSRLIDNAKMFCLKSGDNPQIPDYALDVHTRRGKAMGRSYSYFLKEGRVLNNFTDIDGDAEYNKFFEHLTDYQEKRVPITGYDPRNVYHKSVKDMNEHKNKASQPVMFGNEKEVASEAHLG